MAEPISNKKIISFAGRNIDQDEFIRRAQAKAVDWMDYQGLQGNERQSFLDNFNKKIRKIANGDTSTSDYEIKAVDSNRNLRKGFDPNSNVDTYLNGIASAMPETKSEEKANLLSFNKNTMNQYISNSIFGEGHALSADQLNAWADAYDKYTEGKPRSTKKRIEFINQQLAQYKQDLLDGKYNISEEDRDKEIAKIDELLRTDIKDWERTKVAPWMTNLLFTGPKYGEQVPQEAETPTETSQAVAPTEVLNTQIPVETTKETPRLTEKEKKEQNKAFSKETSTEDVARVVSLVGDLVSLGGTYANIGGTVVSTGSDLVADIASGESLGTTLWNAAQNVGFGVLGLIPGGKAAKLTKYAKHLPRIMATLGTMGIVLDTEGQAALKKAVTHPEQLTSGDVKALTRFGRSATGVVGSGKAIVAQKKVAKYQGKSYAEIKTKKGNTVYLAKEKIKKLQKAGNSKGGQKAADDYLKQNAVNDKGEKAQLASDDGLTEGSFDDSNGIMHRIGSHIPGVKSVVADKVEVGPIREIRTQEQLNEIARLRRIRELHKKKHPISDFFFNRQGWALGKNNPGLYFDRATADVNLPKPSTTPSNTTQPSAPKTTETVTPQSPASSAETPKPAETVTPSPKPAETGGASQTEKQKTAAEVIIENVNKQSVEESKPHSSGKRKIPDAKSEEGKSIRHALDVKNKKGVNINAVRRWMSKYSGINTNKADIQSDIKLSKAVADLLNVHTPDEVATMLTNEQFVKALKSTYKFKTGGIIPFLKPGNKVPVTTSTASTKPVTTSTASSNKNSTEEEVLFYDIVGRPLEGDLNFLTGDLSSDNSGKTNVVDVVDTNANYKKAKPTIGNTSDLALTGFELSKYLKSLATNSDIRNLYKQLEPVHKDFPQKEYRIWSPYSNLVQASKVRADANHLGSLLAKSTSDQGKAFGSQWVAWKNGMEQAYPFLKQYNSDLKDSVNSAISINNENTAERVDVANTNRAADVAKHNQDILADIQGKHDNATKWQQLATTIQNGIAKGAQAKYENAYRSYLSTDRDLILAEQTMKTAYNKYNLDPSDENSRAYNTALTEYNNLMTTKSNQWLAAHRQSLGYPFAPIILTSPIPTQWSWGTYNKEGGVLQEKNKMKRHYDRLFYNTQKLLVTESNKKQRAMSNGYAYFHKIMMQGKP